MVCWEPPLCLRRDVFWQKCITVLLSRPLKHSEEHANSSARSVATCHLPRPATESLIHVVCMSRVLDMFWPMAAWRRRGGVVQTGRCKMVGRGWTQLQIEADGYVRDFNQIQSLSLHRGTQGSAGSTASSGVGAHTVQGGRQPATLTGTQWKRKKKKERSPQRYGISL